MKNTSKIYPLFKQPDFSKLGHFLKDRRSATAQDFIHPRAFLQSRNGHAAVTIFTTSAGQEGSSQDGHDTTGSGCQGLKISSAHTREGEDAIKACWWPANLSPRTPRITCLFRVLIPPRRGKQTENPLEQSEGI